MTDFSACKLYVIPGERPQTGFVNVYNQAFDLWNRVWSQTFKELDGDSKIQSDDFARQHEILCLFLKGKCIALVCHRYVNLSLDAAQKDSYFRAWPDSAVQKLKSEGSLVVIGSQITVDPEYRKSGPNGGAKNIIAYLSLCCLRELPVDAISGTMRADKGMNKLFYQCGATPLIKSVLFHHVPVDLVAFFPRKKALLIDPVQEALIANLWLHREEDPSISRLHLEIKGRTEAHGHLAA